MSEESNGVVEIDNWIREPKKRLIVGLVLLTVISLAAWLLSGGSDSDNATAPSASAPEAVSLIAVPATIVSKAELVSATKDLGFVIYWNGEMQGTNLELTVLPEGKVFVRYLPTGIAAGAAETYFTVASYYDPAAFEKVQDVGAGAKLVNYGGGAVAASASETDSNIYYAFDGNPVLYNIYSPDPKIGWAALDSATIEILQ